jgi:decaprenylphospho-beta-D-ribofuranose 2-oxidase
MTPPGEQDYVMNWSMTQRSPCYVIKVRDIDEIMQALTTARTRGLSVIPHGAGHSYTDVALNSNGILIDVTGMRSILDWNPVQGIMQVQPGVTMRDVVRVALPDRWWPIVTPSTADATIGGCVAMNVNGKNAWKCGSFGEHLLSLSMLLANGQELTISPKSNLQLFHALVGSAGLLGIITSITLQLQHIPSESVDVLVRPAASLHEIFTLFQEEQSADFLEAWVDGFAGGRHLGRGLVSSTKYNTMSDSASFKSQRTRIPDPLQEGFARCAGKLGRPAVKSGVRIANNAAYWWNKWWNHEAIRQSSLFHDTYYPSAAFTGYRTLLPHGTETFQAFVPYSHAEILFKDILRRSQEYDFMPLWCIIKQHRHDPFLLSYQVDGFSLEVNYQIVPQTVHKLHKMLRDMMELVIAAGGRFYLAKDSLLTSSLYRRSAGDVSVEAFLQIKQVYDPEMLFQSDLFRRVFQEPFKDKGRFGEDASSQGDGKHRPYPLVIQHPRRI